MDKLLWLTSGAVMLALLICIALRALKELFGLELKSSRVVYEAACRLSPAGWPWPVTAAASLGILWLAALLAYRAVSGGFSGFLPYFTARFTEAGDAPHYIFIAENGYVSQGENVNNIVFYPLYPLVMKFVSLLLGGRTALAGMIVSQGCYAASSVVLMKLARRDSAHPGFVMLAYWLYPFGFFRLGVFTEGLFLLLVISGLYLIREGKWRGAGVVSFLCALTRVQGLLLLLPGVYCAWRDIREKGWNRKCLWLLGGICGFGVYLLLNRAVCGSALAFRYYESIEPWWQTAQWLGKTVAQQLDMAIGHPGLANWIYWPQLFLYYIAAILLYTGFKRRVDMSYILYGTAYLGMCYTASWLISGGRYMLGCVPLFFCVGSIRRDGVRVGVLLAELAFFGLYTYYYMQGQAIM